MSELQDGHRITFDNLPLSEPNPTAGSDDLFRYELEPWVFFWVMPAALQFSRIVVWLVRNKTPGVKVRSCNLYQ